MSRAVGPVREGGRCSPEGAALGSGDRSDRTSSQHWVVYLPGRRSWGRQDTPIECIPVRIPSRVGAVRGRGTGVYIRRAVESSHGHRIRLTKPTTDRIIKPWPGHAQTGIFILLDADEPIAIPRLPPVARPSIRKILFLAQQVAVVPGQHGPRPQVVGVVEE
jgi:hypothetical protein